MNFLPLAPTLPISHSWLDMAVRAFDYAQLLALAMAPIAYGLPRIYSKHAMPVQSRGFSYCSFFLSKYKLGHLIILWGLGNVPSFICSLVLTTAETTSSVVSEFACHADFRIRVLAAHRPLPLGLGLSAFYPGDENRIAIQSPG